MEPRPPVTQPSRPVTQTHPSNPVAPSGLPAPTRARPVARPSVTHGAPPARGATLPVGDPNLSVQAGCALLSARPPGRLAPPSRHAGCALGDPARRARRILRPPECPPAQALASVPERGGNKLSNTYALCEREKRAQWFPLSPTHNVEAVGVAWKTVFARRSPDGSGFNFVLGGRGWRVSNLSSAQQLCASVRP